MGILRAHVVPQAYTLNLKLGLQVDAAPVAYSCRVHRGLTLNNKKKQQ